MAEEKNTEQKPLTGENEPLITWKSPDIIQRDRSKSWYVIILLVAVVLSIFLAHEELWTGLALVVVAVLILLISSRLKAKEVVCTIYPDGIVAGDNVYKFSEFKSFWINNAELPKVKLQRIGRFAGTIDMPLLGVDIEGIRSILIKHIPEEGDKGEDLVDIINRIIKF